MAIFNNISYQKHNVLFKKKSGEWFRKRILALLTKKDQKAGNIVILPKRREVRHQEGKN